MLTTAGRTFLTKGAKLCCCIKATGEVIVCAAGEGGVGFSAQTIGDKTSVAPSPKPSAAARPRVTFGSRILSAEKFTILSSYCTAGCTSPNPQACESDRDRLHNCTSRLTPGFPPN
jgi:hypothetical protein